MRMGSIELIRFNPMLTSLLNTFFMFSGILYFYYQNIATFINRVFIPECVQALCTTSACMSRCVIQSALLSSYHGQTKTDKHRNPLPAMAYTRCVCCATPLNFKINKSLDFVNKY
jgi:hypothetical protein